MDDNKKVVVNLAPGQEKARIELIEGVKMLAGEYEYHYTGFTYTAQSTKAVIDLIKHLTKDKPQHTIIFYDSEKVEVIVDETVQHRPQDVIKYQFQESLEILDWKKVFNKPLSQKDFIDFLKRRDRIEIDDIDQLMAAVQTIKMATEISGEFLYQDNNNVTVGFKIKDKESATTFPGSFNIYVPIISESDKFDILEVELQVNKPRNEGEKLSFTLECPKYAKYWREAVRAEIETLKAELPNYLIVAGCPS